MNNELYYNKYLFNQSGGRSIPVSTYDQIGGRDKGATTMERIESDNVVDAAKNLAKTALNAVGVITSKFAQKGLKEGTEMVDKGLDQALGLDPNKDLKSQAADIGQAIKKKGELAVEVVKNENFQAGLKDAAEAGGEIIDTAADSLQPVLNTAIKKTGETFQNNSEKIAQTAIKAGTGAGMAALAAVPVAGSVAQVVVTGSDVVKNGASIVQDTSNTIGAITGEANQAAQETIGATKKAQSKLTDGMGRIVKAIDEVTTMVQKGQSAIESGANLDDLKKQASDKMKSVKANATKNLVDAGAEASGMKGTVKAARALGMSDENILKKSAKIASKTAAVAAGGGKTRKKRKRKNKTRNKKRRRNKSKKGRRSRKLIR